MVQMTIEMSEEALAALRKDPENFARRDYWCRFSFR